MSRTLTNMFVHNYKLPQHHSFPPPPTHTPSQPQWLPQHPFDYSPSPPNFRKRQGSNADQLKTKRTQRKTNEADGVEDDDDDDVEDPPVSRGGKLGRAVKKGPPRRYVGHDRQRSCPYFFVFLVFPITYLFFSGKLPTNGLTMTGKCPYKGTQGMIVMIVPFFLFFFCFSITF